MLKKYLVPIFIFLLIPCLIGCGKGPETSGTATTVVETFPVKADNPQVRELNQQLGEIKNQATAEKAVNTFVNYVDSRVTSSSLETSSVSLRSYLESKNLIKRIAACELALRNEKENGVKTLSTDGEEIPIIPLDVAAITDTINILAGDQNVKVNDEIVTKAKIAVEESIPNLNANKSEEMSPLEGMVIGYGLTTGDDGSAPEKSVNLPIQKANEFVERIIP